jgi:hypothetical protein
MNMADETNYKVPEHKVQEEMEANYNSTVNTPAEPRTSEEESQTNILSIDEITDEIDNLAKFFDFIIDSPEIVLKELKNAKQTNKNKNTDALNKIIANLIKDIQNKQKTISKPAVIIFLKNYKIFLCQYLADYFSQLLKTPINFKNTLIVMNDFLERKKATYLLSSPEIYQILEKINPDKNKSLLDIVDELEIARSENTAKMIMEIILPTNPNQTSGVALNIAFPIIQGCATLLIQLQEKLKLPLEKPSEQEKNKSFFI